MREQAMIRSARAWAIVAFGVAAFAIGCGPGAVARPASPRAASPRAASPFAAPVERFGDGRYRLALHHMPFRTYRAVPRTGIPAPAAGAHLRFAEVACEEVGAASSCKLASASDHARPDLRAVADRMQRCYALEPWQPSELELAAIASGQSAPGSVGSLAVVRRTRTVARSAPRNNPLQARGAVPKSPRPDPLDETTPSTPTTTSTVEAVFAREIETSPPFATEEKELFFFESSRGTPIDALLARAVAAAAGGRAEDWGRARRVLATIDASTEPPFVRILVAEDLAIAAVFSGDYVTARDAMRELGSLSPDFDRAGREMNAELDPRMRKPIPSAHYANAAILDEIVSGAVTLRDPCGR